MSASLYETTYINGGVTNALRKLFVANGYKPTAEEMLTMAAHDAMPRGLEYTQSELDAKREDLRAYADRVMPGWESDPYLDLYGVPAAPGKCRLSKYDREHGSK